MKEPVTATDGYTYDRANIVEWWKYCGEVISPMAPALGVRMEQTLIPTKVPMLRVHRCIDEVDMQHTRIHTCMQAYMLTYMHVCVCAR